jgi:hypothetical protein
MEIAKSLADGGKEVVGALEKRIDTAIKNGRDDLAEAGVARHEQLTSPEALDIIGPQLTARNGALGHIKSCAQARPLPSFLLDEIFLGRSAHWWRRSLAVQATMHARHSRFQSTGPDRQTPP